MSSKRPLRLFISYSHADEKLRARLDAHLAALRNEGRISTWHDRRVAPGTEWERQIHAELDSADVVLLLISADFLASKYCYDVEMDRALKLHEAGMARVVPVIVRPSDWEGSRFAYLQALPKNSKPVTSWRNREEAWTDVAKSLRTMLQELRPADERPAVSAPPGDAPTLFLETGAMPLDSPYYVARPSDDRAARQLRSPQPTVTLRGERQSGKSSLLVRLRQQAREDGWRSCYLNFQNLDQASFESPDALFLELARMTVDALDVDADPDDAWSPRRGAKRNWTRFMEREVFDSSTPMLLLFDEVDLAFENDACRFDLFSMLRVWHNRRSEDLEGRWKGLGLVIAHRSEPGDWIEDVNQSPFNVGLQLVLEDFGDDEIKDLDRRHGEPLGNTERQTRFLTAVGGHPFAVRRAFYEMVAEGRSLEDLETLL